MDGRQQVRSIHVFDAVVANSETKESLPAREGCVGDLRVAASAAVRIVCAGVKAAYLERWRYRGLDQCVSNLRCTAQVQDDALASRSAESVDSDQPLRDRSVDRSRLHRPAEGAY